MSDTAVLIVVFDGLRPDMIDADAAPNLVRFAAGAHRWTEARSVFPSETRVATSSMATGCHPSRHGMVSNRLVDPRDPSRTVETGHVAQLRSLRDELREPLLDVPTLGEWCARSGRRFAALTSGSTGQGFMLNPHADALGQVTLSAHGAEGCSDAGREILDRLAPPPKPPADRAIWIADAFRTQMLDDPPDIAVLWLCEPDTTAHYGGLGSLAQRDALRKADAAFGRIADACQSGPAGPQLTIIVASDHGHTTIEGHVDVAAEIAAGGAASPALAGCRVIAGSSGGIVVPGGSPDRITAVTEWLMRQPWCGMVLAADAADLLPGVLPRSAALVEHARAAHVLFTLRTGASVSASSNLPGTSLFDGSLAIGAGTHGGLSWPELRTVLMMAGPGVRPGVSDLPAGIVDIAPTALSLLGIPGGEVMDGRVLAEALDGADANQTTVALVDLWEASGPGYAQRLARRRIGRHAWLDHGQRM